MSYSRASVYRARLKSCMLRNTSCTNGRASALRKPHMSRRITTRHLSATASKRLAHDAMSGRHCASLNAGGAIT